MAYIKTEVIAGNDIYTYKGHSTRYGQKVVRGKNVKVTSHQQKKINKRIKQQKNLWTASANFSKGDFWVTLTYRRQLRPQDIKTAHENIMKILAKIRRKLKKNNIPLKYMAKTEKGEKGAIHHHLLLKNTFDIGTLISLWSLGHIEISDIYTDSMAVLGDYFSKESEKGKGESIISCSRNLDKPIIKKTVVKANTFADEPTPKKGYNIIHTYKGYQSSAGYLYQEYIQTKAEPTQTNGKNISFRLFNKKILA